MKNEQGEVAVPGTVSESSSAPAYHVEFRRGYFVVVDVDGREVSGYHSLSRSKAHESCGVLNSGVIEKRP